jgi:RHH-type transcriptional regulator, proline utilization regulon repressor / proline dehydrogenase / delta 1-pyrroline-5-carboxylate dehydrogenase
MVSLTSIRGEIRQMYLADETNCLEQLAADAPIPRATRERITKRAIDLVRAIRADGNPGLMEVFLAEYGLSTDEGVALMCLAEALLRVPDAATIDALIEDKIAPSAWGAHLGHSSSSLVNASTWALMLTGKVLQDGEGAGITASLHGAIKRLGEPVIRRAVQAAIREMGHQFVLGRDIGEAVSRGGKLERQGYRFSYDMLGEAALTAADAQKYSASYSAAITELAQHCTSGDIRENPGISVKLSALHPRYELGQQDRVKQELVPVLRKLARQAAKAGMGFNIDAEEADRLDLSLDVIEAVLRDPDLAGWDGFGVVVQAYGPRAGAVLDWLYTLAEKLDRRIMVRLVKGAYWDSEIKRAQIEGLAGFAVFTSKAASDVSYIHCAARLMAMRDRIYPQFATHNAHTVAAVLELSGGKAGFEFQRLQGMGETLHRLVKQAQGTRCRIYAPVGTHRDLLAYLVRRLLENGANSSFVNQIVDEDVPPEVVAADPFAALAGGGERPGVLLLPADLYAPERRNSRGFDLHSHSDLAVIERARAPFLARSFSAGPLIAGPLGAGEAHEVFNPARPDDLVGKVIYASGADVETALASAMIWQGVRAEERADILGRAADLYEQNFGAFFALLCREAGKTPADAISELREAVDFLRFYGAEGARLKDTPARGLITCISPWNFPLAIFTGQIAAALAAGNGVLAKPAETTALTAHFAVRLLHEAGVPREVLQLLPGTGPLVGALLTQDSRVAGVCFTGSTATALSINRAMAKGLAPSAPLIAETGGLNAMIVDSTALPEQAVRDVIDSAFQSAGQRCSALRMLYVQRDVAPSFLDMLFGAMDELKIGDPWEYATDIGPVISVAAAQDISDYVAMARAEGRLLKQLQIPEAGCFTAPSVIRVDGISDLSHEVFGPVLHVAVFDSEEIDAIVDGINASGYGLTFGMHSRIDDRVEQVTARLRVGNIYINRNQIGAVVGSQPFGGEGLSGTGPKAGGPNYVAMFAGRAFVGQAAETKPAADISAVQTALDALAGQGGSHLSTETLPGPTGESNRLSLYGRGTVLCLGPTADQARLQAETARQNGCAAVLVAPGLRGKEGVDGFLARAALGDLTGFHLVALESETQDMRRARIALAHQPGPLITLAGGDNLAARCRLERHICIDTTAAGGNASLLAAG